jgi:hypothetical protein
MRASDATSTLASQLARDLLFVDTECMQLSIGPLRRLSDGFAEVDQHSGDGRVHRVPVGATGDRCGPPPTIPAYETV